MNTYTQGTDIIIEATFYDGNGVGRSNGMVTFALQYLSEGSTQFYWYDWKNSVWSSTRGVNEELSNLTENENKGYSFDESGEGGYIITFTNMFTANLPAGIYKWEATITDTPQEKQSSVFELKLPSSHPNIPIYNGTGLTVQQMQDEVTKRCFKDTTTFRAMITAWLNEAQQRIVTLANGRWWWMESSATVSAEALADRFSVPVDFFEFVDKYSLKDVTSNQILARVGHEQFEKNLSSNAGQPATYCIFDKDSNGRRIVRFNPASDSERIFKLDYYKVLPDLKTDSDVSQIPYWYHYLLIEFAVMRGQEHRQQAQMADLAHQQWLDGILQLLIEADAKNDRQAHPVIRWR